MAEGQPTRSFESNAITFYSGRWLYWFTGLQFVALVLMLLPRFGVDLPWLTLLVVALSILVMGGFAFRSRHARLGPGILSVEADELLINRASRSKRNGSRLKCYRLATPRQGWITPANGSAYVSLRLDKGGTIQVTLSEPDSVKLLRAARMDTTDGLLRYPLGAAGSTWSRGHRFNARLERSPLLTAVSAIAVVLAPTLGVSAFAPTEMGRFIATGLPVAFALGMSFAVVLLASSNRTAVVIGSDGLRLESLGFTRFVPYREIEHLRDTPDRIWLQLVDGTELDLRTWHPEAGGKLESGGLTFLSTRKASSQYRVRLLREIERARLAARTQQGSEHSAVPARRGRDIEQWKRAIQAATHDSYRQAALTAQQLLEIVADADAPAERRVGALYGISTLENRSPGFDARVQRAIERCAHPRLRVALQQAQQDELDADVLEEIDQIDETEGAAAKALEASGRRAAS